MKLKITHSDHCLAITFTGQRRSQNVDYDFYFMPQELESFGGRLTVARDCNRYLILENYRLLVVDCSDTTPINGLQDATFELPGFALHCDTVKLCRVLLQLHAKKVAAVLDSERFACRPQDIPPLTITQMVRHPNANGPIATTLAFFKRHLKPEEWVRLCRSVSHYLTLSKFYAHRDEFYFDGRYAGGVGFNGGFILHGDTFGIHT
jgi:hypothetical protein